MAGSAQKTSAWLESHKEVWSAQHPFLFDFEDGSKRVSWAGDPDYKWSLIKSL